MASGRDELFDAATLPSSEQATAPAAQAAATGGPIPGQTWDRYVVIAPLGAGGMGAVWAAYDTELERKVALKVLHDELLGRASQERLRREAKAMARVSHPNVVPVFDVGEHAGRSFYTMELVRGESIKDWARTPRPWREVAAVFVEAARGLAAIHATGLAHRDVKPGNILRGEDGRTRIADLGIAMSAPELPAADDAIPLVATTTLRHAGTPAYMAPEQLRGAAGDAASDQFAFGVALWEVLHGRPPFDGTTREQRLAAIARGPTPVRDVPGWLDAAARRALAPDPAARFPDVATLARALEGPRARRWPWIASAAAVAAAGAAVAVALFVRTPDGPPPRDSCARAGHELDAAWPPGAAHARARALFDQHRARDADPAAVTAALDTRVADWRAVARDACQRGFDRTWSPRLDARATRCVARRRLDLEAAIAAESPEELSDRVARLVPARRCLDSAFLLAQVEPPQEPVTVALVDALHTLVRVADIDIDATAIGPAGRALDAIQPTADRLAYSPLRAEIAEARAWLLSTRGDPRGAQRVLEEGYYAARAAGDDGHAQTAATSLVELAAAQLGDDALADRWLKIARADAIREPDTDDAPDVFLAAAQVELQRHDPVAVADAQRGLLMYVRIYGEDSGMYRTALETLASALDATGHSAEAIPYYERALGRAIDWYGARNVRLAPLFENVALAYSAVGRDAEAIKAARAAVDLLDGPDPSAAELAAALHNLGAVLDQAGRPAEAVTALARAVALMRGLPPEQVSAKDAATAAVDLGLARAHATGDGDRAGLLRVLADQRDALDESRRAHGDGSPFVAVAENDLAYTLRRLGRCADALPVAQHAFTVQSQSGNREWAAFPLELIGSCQLELRDFDGAIATMREAIELRAGGHAGLRAADGAVIVRAELARGRRDAAIEAELTRMGALVADQETDELAAALVWIAWPVGAPR